LSESDIRIYTRKQYIAAVRAAKVRGREEAIECLQDRISNTKNIISECVEIIFDLDKNEPIAGVVVPYSLCEKIIKKLKKERGVLVPDEMLEKLMTYLKKKHVITHYTALKDCIEQDKKHEGYAERLEECMCDANTIDMEREEVLKVIEEISNY
jgi:hypothetical protein